MTFLTASIWLCVALASLGLVWMALPMSTISTIWPTAYDATPEQRAAGGMHPELLGLLGFVTASLVGGWLYIIREAIRWYSRKKSA